MQQTFRRQLLALGRLSGSPERVAEQCRQFVQSVLAVRIDARPDSEAVLDVLQSNGVSRDVAAHFVDAFDAAVWRTALHPAQ